jgi:hypothetical protein
MSADFIAKIDGVTRYLMSVMVRTADSTRTLRHVANGPQADIRLIQCLAVSGRHRCSCDRAVERGLRG